MSLVYCSRFIRSLLECNATSRKALNFFGAKESSLVLFTGTLKLVIAKLELFTQRVVAKLG